MAALSLLALLTLPLTLGTDLPLLALAHWALPALGHLPLLPLGTELSLLTLAHRPLLALPGGALALGTWLRQNLTLPWLGLLLPLVLILILALLGRLFCFLFSHSSTRIFYFFQKLTTRH